MSDLSSEEILMQMNVRGIDKELVEMANLVEAIQKRCNELRDKYLPEYDKIPTGVFAASMIRQSIREAEAAIASGDVVACVKSLKDLQGYSL